VVSFALCRCLNVWKISIFVGAMENLWMQHQQLCLRKDAATARAKIPIGVRQVDVYAGLNVMILLLELHRYAQSRDDLKDEIAFYLCGQKDTEGFDRFRLLRMIGYSHCVSFLAFLETVGQFLSRADLSRAKLSRANLSDADLSDADLSDADLNGAYLSRANLRGAYLRGAYLRGANLENISWDEYTNWEDVKDLRQQEMSQKP
jgi:hypothetical protein